MWNKIVEWYPNNHTTSHKLDIEEIQDLFRSWMIFIVITGLFLIGMGVVAFFKMKGYCPEYQRWITLFVCIIAAALNSWLAIRNYKGKF